MIPRLERTFLAFRLTVGAAILLESAHTAIVAARTHGHPADPHLALLAGVEVVAAALFLIPRTLRAGGMGLLVVLLVAAVAHATRGEFPAGLIVYAAAVAFVVVHGPHGTRSNA